MASPIVASYFLRRVLTIIFVVCESEIEPPTKIIVVKFLDILQTQMRNLQF